MASVIAFPGRFQFRAGTPAQGRSRLASSAPQPCAVRGLSSPGSAPAAAPWSTAGRAIQATQTTEPKAIRKPVPKAAQPAPHEGFLALEGEGLSEHFRAWFGRSGRRYIVTIHALDEADLALDYDSALLLAVRRNGAGAPTLIDGCDSGEATTAALHRWINAMRGAGATELHVHLLAHDRQARQRMLSDLVA